MSSKSEADESSAWDSNLEDLPATALEVDDRRRFEEVEETLLREVDLGEFEFDVKVEVDLVEVLDDLELVVGSSFEVVRAASAFVSLDLLVA